MYIYPPPPWCDAANLFDQLTYRLIALMLWHPLQQGLAMYVWSVASCVVFLQRASIQSALSLISDSLVSLDNTFQLINSPVSVATILELIEVADKRADDVSGLARRLLNILQNHSEAESETTAQGVTGVCAVSKFGACSPSSERCPSTQKLVAPMLEPTCLYYSAMN